MNILRRFYQSAAQRIYAVGKQEYERRTEAMLRMKGVFGEGTRLYAGAEILNLSARAQNIRTGNNCHISGMLLVYNYGGNITLGDNCSLSPNSRIVSVKDIQIGNRVLIAHNVNIIDNISHPLDARLRHEDFIKSYTVGMEPYDLKGSAILIGNDVWIGFNSTILRGVTIGAGAVIGAGSMVTRDVPPWTVNVGNPLRCIRHLEPIDIKDE
jgi:acetyltransferase-like isoleucine patch superfamily enzyme